MTWSKTVSAKLSPMYSLVYTNTICKTNTTAAGFVIAIISVKYTMGIKQIRVVDICNIVKPLQIFQLTKQNNDILCGRLECFG